MRRSEIGLEPYEFTQVQNVYGFKKFKLNVLELYEFTYVQNLPCRLNDV